MSVVHIIDALTNWAREHICKEIKLKVPPADETEPMDTEYIYQLANPAAFPMYIPTGDKFPNGIHFSHPSLCVRFLSAQDDLAQKIGGMDVQIVFCVWDPGKHSEDIFHPNGDGSFRRQEAAETEFEQDGLGWRDVWNFVDLAVRKLESADHIGPCTIDKSVPFEYGPVKVDEAIADFYPFWYAELSFHVTYPLMRNNEEYDQYL